MPTIEQNPNLSTLAVETEMKFLLILPYLGLLAVPFYNSAGPELFGFPFFYWYQFAWVPATALLTFLVYRATRKNEDETTTQSGGGH